MDLSDVIDVVRVDDEDGFGLLVLPQNHKDIVKSQVKQHFQEEASASVDKYQNDLVRGKGTNDEMRCTTSL